MNIIVNKLLLDGDKFMPELRLRQLGFTDSASGPFTKHRQRIRKFIGRGGLNYGYKNEVHNSCYADNVEYSDCKEFAKRTLSDKISQDRAYKIAINC